MLKHLSIFILIVLLLAGVLASCQNEPIVEADPAFLSFQNTLQNEASSGKLYAQAYVKAGLLSEVADDRFPVMILALDNAAFESYLKASNLSREAFLNSPKLKDFMSHLIYPDYADQGKWAEKPNTTRTYTNLAGVTDTFEIADLVVPTPENPYPAKINGVPFNPACGDFVKSNLDYDDLVDLRGWMCNISAIPVQAFAWQ